MFVKEYTTHRYFKFGDGKSVKAHKRVRLPGYINKERIEHEAEVIISDTPLLLSTSFMKKLGTVIDLGDDRIRWKGDEIKD